MKCEIERMEINYTFYFFAFLRKMIKKLLTFCYWWQRLSFVWCWQEEQEPESVMHRQEQIQFTFFAMMFQHASVEAVYQVADGIL